MKRAQQVIEIIGGTAIAVVMAVYLFLVVGGGVTGLVFVAVIAVICAVLAAVDHRQRIRSNRP